MADLFNRFEKNPSSVNITRSRFMVTPNHTTSLNAGDLIPVKWIECLPGDTFSVDLASVCRMNTPKVPVMDNAFLDTFAFYIPYRLVWNHFKEFMGESIDEPWYQNTEYTIPQINIFGNGKGSFYDHLGVPLTKQTDLPLSINALPIRAYGLIWNEWFRDQNVSAPLSVNISDSSFSAFASYGNQYSWFNLPPNSIPPDQADMVTNWIKYGIPLPVAKFHDYFTSALPQPQKGPAVNLPISDDAFLTVFSEEYDLTGQVKFSHSTSTASDSLLVLNGSNVLTEQPVSSVPNTTGTSGAVDRTNLGVDLSNASAISVNTLRQMFALQRLYETDARGGTRFRETILAHFGVKTLDAAVQIPQFLAGKRIPLNMTSVPQTSATSDISPQGNLAAFSHTSDKDSMFTFSCTEPGLIMFLSCVRTEHTYSQGIEKKWFRKRRYDMYWPVFANLGEQPIYNKELYVDPDRDDINNISAEDEVFGYQEAWAEYRYMPNTVSGFLRPSYDLSVPWTYADHFNSSPTLSPEFIYETRENIDRTLSVPSTVEDQFIVDFNFRITMVRPMPLYSIPGIGTHM